MKSGNDSLKIAGKAYQRNIKNDSPDSSRANDSEAVVSGNNPFVLFSNCLIDYSGRQFSCVHGHCMKQKNCMNTDQLTDRLFFQELHFHPADRVLWCDEVFPDIFKFLYSEPNAESFEYRFIFNHRYIRKDGSVSQFMHEGALTFENDTWLPVLNLKVFLEIADIKSDATIVFTLFKYSNEDGFRKIFKKVYGTTCESFLSKRELEIIRLCHEGLSSKMIAEKLKRSIHTIKNHKRNSMEKTLTHNISELIHFCISNNWI